MGSLQWTVERGGQSQTVRMVAEAKPDAKPSKKSAEALKLRYNGTLGPAQVEVRGAPVNVTEDEQTGELVIRSHDLLVRVKIPGERSPRG
ncbi:MAG TPA: hypothetical protein VJ725_02385 [Thermoanaerobaculia bacterium]|nr:hypothetical protein [Thermoanaerobaculia bacterium]